MLPLSRGRLPAAGRSPSGGKDHFFFRGKRNGPSPQRKRGARSMQGLWAKTAASGFRMTERTLPGRYGLPFGNRDSLRSIHPPPAGVSLRAWRPARHLRGGGLPGLILWGATTRRAIPCVGAAWGRPPGAGFPPGGRSPSGGACPAGAKTISFSAEKETVLDSKEKVRPVYGWFVVDHGGFRLYALFGDQPRPLRPSHSGTGERR